MEFEQTARNSADIQWEELAMAHPYEYLEGTVAHEDVNTRAAFIRKTYLHLFAAIIGFTVLEVYIFQSGLAQSILNMVASMGVLLFFGAFVVLGWIGSRVAHTVKSIPLQYLALAFYVVLEAVFFVPLLAYAMTYSVEIIESAAYITLAGFGALTAIAFITQKDFSFLRGVLYWGGICAVLLILGGIIFNFDLGIFFSVAMVALAGASILYDTSNVIHHFPKDRYVGAALQLFASVALMFWYVLRIFIASEE